MTTSGVASTSSNASASSSSSKIDKTALGKDDFMKLLLAQLANQDPTNPANSQDFVAQLAQFSSVEQLQSINSSIGSMVSAQTSTYQTSIVSLVGKDAVLNSDTVSIASGKSSSIYGTLKGDADSVTAVITDSSGKTVRTIKADAQSAGNLEIAWDGRDDKGSAVSTGNYSVRLSASKGGKTVEVSQQTTARITGVTFDDGVPELMLGNRKAKLSDLVQVSQGA